jgi:hypothetical protein
MSQIVPLGSLTHWFVLRLQQVTPGQSLSVVQAAVEVAVAVVLIHERLMIIQVFVICHYLSILSCAVKIN